MFRPAPSKHDHANKPEPEQQIQMRITSILEDEIREALENIWIVSSFAYVPARNYTQTKPHYIHSQPGAHIACIIRRHEDSRTPIKKIYRFDEYPSIEKMVQAINLTLQGIPFAKTINPDQVLEKYFNDIMLIAPLNPTNKAVYISGADPLLGEWKTAKRLSYNETKKQWRFFLPYGVTKREVKFLTGDRHLGKEEKVGSLQWEEHQNRLLPIEEKKDASPRDTSPRA